MEKRYGNSYKTAPKCVERILKWTGYKVRVKKEAGFECPWDEKTPYDHFRYRVSITAPGGESAWFRFWGSVVEYHENGALGAGFMIGFWVMGRDYARMDFEEFCAETGYSDESRPKALRVWKECWKIAQTTERMFSDRIIEALEHCAYNL